MSVYQVILTHDVSNFRSSVFFGNTSALLTWDGLHLACRSPYDALWAFDGWGSIPYIVEELENPVRDVPLLTFTAIPAVSLIYVVLNLAFMTTLSNPIAVAIHLMRTEFIKSIALFGNSPFNSR